MTENDFVLMSFDKYLTWAASEKSSKYLFHIDCKSRLVKQSTFEQI